MSLYNCKIDGDDYRITKFDSNLEVEASYLTSESECECPAGHRPTCRHRKMLPMFLGRKADQGQWFLDFDRLQWHKAEAEILNDLQTDLEASLEVEAGPSPAMVEASTTRTINLLDLAKDITATEINERMAESAFCPRSVESLAEALVDSSITILHQITLPDNSTGEDVANAFANLQSKPMRRI